MSLATAFSNDKSKHNHPILRNALIGGGLGLAGLGASFLPAALPVLKLRSNLTRNKLINSAKDKFLSSLAKNNPKVEPNVFQKKYLDSLESSKLPDHVMHGEAINSYLDSANKLFQHPLGHFVRENIREVRNNIPTKSILTPLNKAYFGNGKGGIDTFKADHYLNFSAGKNTGLNHWLWETGVENDNRLAKAKQNIIDELLPGNKRQISHEQFENLLNKNPSLGDTPTDITLPHELEKGENNLGSYNSLKKKTEIQGKMYHHLNDLIQKNIRSGMTEDQAISNLTHQAKDDKLLKQTLRKLFIHKAEAYKLYSNAALASPGLIGAGLATAYAGSKLNSKKTSL